MLLLPETILLMQLILLQVAGIHVLVQPAPHSCAPFPAAPPHTAPSFKDGSQCSTRWLREHYGFSGLLLDGGFQNPAINLWRELINAENICGLLARHGVPADAALDHMTVDIE